MPEVLNYFIFANIAATITIILSRERSLSSFAVIAWLASWFLIAGNSSITASIFNTDSLFILGPGMLIVVAASIKFATNPSWGFWALVLMLPFRLPVMLFGLEVDIRKIFVVFIAATLLGLIRDDSKARPALDKIIAVLFALVAASFFWAVNSQDALIRYVFFFAPFVLLYKTTALFDVRHNAKRLVTVTLILAFAIASYGLATSIQPIASNSLPKVAPDWKYSVKKGSAELFMSKTKNSFWQNIELRDKHSQVRLFQEMKIPKKKRRLKISARFRNEGIEQAAFIVTFYRKSLKSKPGKKKISSHNIYIEKNDNLEWTEFSKKLKAPPKANLARMTIKLSAKDTPGVFSIDKINVDSLKIKNQDFNSGGYITKFIKKIRASSVFWDPNVFAKYLVFSLLIGSVALFESRRFGLLKTSVLVVPSLIAGFAALFLTISRSGFLSLLLGLLILMFAFVFGNYRKIYGMAALACILAVSGFLIVKPPDFADRLNFFGAQPDLEEIMAVSGGRNYLMEAGIKMVEAQPVMGFGLGGFSDIYHKYKAKEAPNKLTESHNSFLTVASEQGLVGLTLMMWLICTTIYYFIVVLVRKKNDPVFIGSFAVLMAFSLNSMVYAYFFEDPFTWFVLGLISGSEALKNDQ